MGKLAVVVLLVFLAAGGAVVYVMYRQLGSDTVILEASPELIRNEQGALCADVQFDVGARSLGRWLFRVEKGQTISGVVSVAGDAQSDIGFGIWSPTNRVVVFNPRRAHEYEFEVPGTIRGDYRFDFDNRHSSFGGKQVSVSLCLA